MMPLIPARMAAVWILVLLLVGALHVRHARSARGAMTGWHAVHVSMVAGMILMLLALPHDGSAAGAPVTPAWPTLHAALVVFYVGQAAAIAVALGRVAADRRVWLTATLDLLVMAYMLLPAAARPTAVTYVAVAYLSVAAVAWLAVPGGWLRMTASRSGPRSPTPAVMAAPGSAQFHALARPPVQPSAATPERPSVSLLGRPQVPPFAPSPAAVGVTAVIDGSPATSISQQRVPARFAEHLPAAVRLTVAVMVVSMAWMLLAM